MLRLGSLLCVAMAAACAGASAQEAPDAEGEAAPASPKRAAVEVLPLTALPFVDSVTLVAHAEPRREARLGFEQPGTLTRLVPEAGDQVRKGQVLGRLDATVRSAEIDGSEAVLSQARSELARLERLAESELATERDLTAARSLVDQSDAAVRAARGLLKGMVITAPFDAVVEARMAEPGERLNPGQTALHLLAVDPIKVVVHVPEYELGAAVKAETLELRFDAWPDEVFLGRRIRVGMSAANPSRTYPLELEVDNPELRLRPGLMARAQLVRRERPDAVLVPREAVLTDVDGLHAFVVEEGDGGLVARHRKLSLGAQSGELTEVLSGLEAGERLVVLGQRGLVDGQAVKIASTRPALGAEQARGPGVGTPP